MTTLIPACAIVEPVLPRRNTTSVHPPAASTPQRHQIVVVSQHHSA